MSNKTIEQKKKDYRDYLENSGVLEQITKALVSLYEEIDRPVNPIEYIRRNLVDPDEEINDKKKKNIWIIKKKMSNYKKKLKI